MLQESHAFSGFSVDDLAAAKQFYGATLGLAVEETPQGLFLHLTGGAIVFIYAKDDHQPASYTMLNFPVDDIDQAVGYLKAKGISLEHYAGMTGEDGVARGKASGQGPDIAWFKDPAGNIVAVLSN